MASEIPLLPNLTGMSSSKLVNDWVTNQLLRLSRGNPPHFLKMLYLESPPGYMKTATMKQIARRLNEEHPVLKGKVILIETVLASMTTTADIGGTGFPVMTRTEPSSDADMWLVPAAQDNMPRRRLVRTWTPTLVQLFRAAHEGKYVIWFFDEFNNITPQWEAFFLKLAERRLSDRPLPANFILTGAGNPVHQSIGERMFGESILHRMYRVDFVPEFGEWRDFMLGSPASPVRHVIRRSVTDFLESESGKYFLNGPWKKAPHQLGYIATNPRHWAKTSDLISRCARFFPDTLTPSTLQWLAERRLPAEVVKKYGQWFEGNYRSQLTDVLKAEGLLRPTSVAVPAAVSASPAPETSPGATGETPEVVRKNGRGSKLSVREPSEVRNALLKRAEETARKHFAADMEAYERMRTLVVSHILDSLLEPSSFQSIPYLLGGPGGGKTRFAYRSVDMANAWVMERRAELEPLAGSSEEAAAELKRLKKSVLLEVVLPAVPSLTELTGPVIPFNFSAKDTKGMKDFEDMVKHLKVAWRVANVTDDLPARYSVNTVTPFLRAVKRYAEQGNQVVVLLDELSNLSPEWEAAFLKFVERKLGSWELTEAVTFLSAGNFASQSTYGRDLGEPAQSRLDFVHFRPNFVEFAEHILVRARSFEKQVARVLVLEYLCHHPEDFYAGEHDVRERVSPRRWERAAEWYGRMTRYYGRPLTQEETVWFLSRILPEKVVRRFAEFARAHGKEAIEQAFHLWRGSRPELLKTDRRAEASSFQPLTDTTLKNDIEQYMYLDAALKAYLLDDLPPVGEFSDFLYLKSPPGYGKTSHVRASIAEVNQIRAKEGRAPLELIEIVLSNAHPSDVVGLVFPVSVPGEAVIDSQGKGIRAPGNEKLPQRHVVTTDTELIRAIEHAFRAGREPVVFIDEMSNITPQWEAILLKVAEGRIGTWVFNRPVRFVTAGNPPAHSQAGREFGETLLERLVVVNYRPNFLNFVARAESPGLDPWYQFAAVSVAQYLKLYPQHFVAAEGDFTSETRMLTPRNWTCVAEDYADLLYSHALQVGAQTPEEAARSLNRSWLRTYLAPHLPTAAADGFVTYIFLQCRITGEDVVCHGKPIPKNLSLEQTQVLVKSVCASLAQHFSSSRYEGTGADLQHYLINFSRFVKQLEAQKNRKQEIDSLFMPSLSDLEQVMRRLYNLRSALTVQKGEVGEQERATREEAIRFFQKIYKVLYDSVRGVPGGTAGSAGSVSPSPSSPSPSTPTPFRSGGGRPPRGLSGPGLS